MEFCELIKEYSHAMADRMVAEMENQCEVYGRARYPITKDFRWGVCQDAFKGLSDGSNECCTSSEIVNVLKRRYGGCTTGVLWQDKKRYIWRLEHVHYVFFRKKNDRVFSCLRNGVNRKRARSDVFASKHYPPGCSPEIIVDVLLAYDKIFAEIDSGCQRVLTSYESIKNKLIIIRQILITANAAKGAID